MSICHSLMRNLSILQGTSTETLKPTIPDDLQIHGLEASHLHIRRLLVANCSKLGNSPDKCKSISGVVSFTLKSGQSFASAMSDVSWRLEKHATMPDKVIVFVSDVKADQGLIGFSNTACLAEIDYEVKGYGLNPSDMCNIA